MSAPEDLPVVSTLAEVARLVERRQGLYVRWSKGPGADLEDVSSTDELTGVPMPGLSANPLDVEDWWEDRSVELWVARRLYDYAHLPHDKGPGVRPWVLRGRETGRGPRQRAARRRRRAAVLDRRRRDRRGPRRGGPAGAELGDPAPPWPLSPPSSPSARGRSPVSPSAAGSGARRRSDRRSSSVVPPQMPMISPDPGALQALLTDRAMPAHRLGLLGLHLRRPGGTDREEQVGVLMTARGMVAPIVHRSLLVGSKSSVPVACGPHASLRFRVTGRDGVKRHNRKGIGTGARPGRPARRRTWRNRPRSTGRRAGRKGAPRRPTGHRRQEFGPAGRRARGPPTVAGRRPSPRAVRRPPLDRQPGARDAASAP